MNVNQFLAYMEVVQMSTTLTHVHVVQDTLEKTALRVYTTFMHFNTTLFGFTINLNYNTKDINDCEPIPCMHGSCADGFNSYTCTCDPGYSETNCNKGTIFYSFTLLICLLGLAVLTLKI